MSVAGISTGVVAVSSAVDTFVGALTLVKEVKSDPRGFLLFCIVVLGDFNYAGFKWAYITLGAIDVVLGVGVL